MGTGFHGLDGGFFADGSGHENERQIQAAVPDHAQRFVPAELRQHIVAEDNIPGAVGQRRFQRLRRLDSLMFNQVSTQLEFADEQARIRLRVFHDQCFEMALHGVPPALGGGSLSSSQ